PRDTPTTPISTLTLHDALPISAGNATSAKSSITVTTRKVPPPVISDTTPPDNVGAVLAALGNRSVLIRWSPPKAADFDHVQILRDRKSTRLNSSHVKISYAVFC